jgi:hypothetical protein
VVEVEVGQEDPLATQDVAEAGEAVTSEAEAHHGHHQDHQIPHQDPLPQAHLEGVGGHQGLHSFPRGEEEAMVGVVEVVEGVEDRPDHLSSPQWEGEVEGAVVVEGAGDRLTSWKS